MRRLIAVIVLAAGLAAAAVYGIEAGARRLVDRDHVLRRLHGLTAPYGVSLEIEAVQPRLLPRPRLTLSGVRVTGSAGVSGTAASVSIFPRLRPLLAGALEVGLVAVNTPDLRVVLDSAGAPPPGAPADVSAGDLRDALAGAVAAAASTLHAAGPGSAVRIDNGTVRVIRQQRTVLLLASTAARLGAPAADRLDLQLRCSSDMWADLAVAGSLAVPGLRGNATFEVVDLRGQPVLQAVAPDRAAALGLTIVSLRGEVSLPGDASLVARVAGSAPTVTLQRAGTAVPLRVPAFAAEVEVAPGRLDVRVNGLEAETPKVALSGRLVLDSRTPQIRIDLHATDADLVGLRTTATALFGGEPAVERLAGIVRAGTARRLTLSAVGASLAELQRPGHHALRASIADARLVVPPFDLPLANAAADLAVAGGMLRADRVAAQIGGVRVRDGHARVPLLPDVRDLALSFNIDAPAAELVPLLHRVVLDEAFRHRLRDLTDISGRLAGHVAVRRTWLGWKARVRSGDFDVTATDWRNALPVHIRGGSASYDGRRIAVLAATGRAGESRLTRVSLRLPLDGTDGVFLRSGPASIDLEDAVRLARERAPEGSPARAIHGASGTVVLDMLTLRRPQAGEPWRARLRGAASDVTLVTTGPLGSVTLTTQFDGSHDLLALTDTTVAWADARLAGSGCLLPGERAPRLDVLMEGVLGPAATEALAAAGGLPPGTGSRKPLTTPDLGIVWQPGGFLAVEGTVAATDGPHLAVDLQWAPGRFDLRRLVVRDGQSDATIRLRTTGASVDAQFRGRLSHDTVDALIARNTYVWGAVEGDLSVRMIRDEPDSVRTSGMLQVAGVLVPLPRGPAAVVDSATVRTDGLALVVDRSAVTWADRSLAVTGRADLTAGRVDLDLDVSAADLDLMPLLAAGAGTPPPGPPAPALPRIPVRGVVRLAAERLTLRHLAWDGLRARLQIADAGTEVLVTNGTLCQIETPATLRFADGDAVSVLVMPRARARSLAATLACLTDGRRAATGSYTLEAQLSGTAPPDGLLRSLEGPVSLEVVDGRLPATGWSGRLLRLLRPTEVFRGRLAGILDDNLDYRAAAVRGTLRGGRLEISEAVLQAAPLVLVASGTIDLVDTRMDLTLLASPGGPPVSAMERLPLVGSLFGAGSPVSIPVAVSGPLDDPSVVPLSPRLVGAQLVRSLERLLTVPVRLIQPLLPDEPRR